jgi:hypothetical protein
MDLDAEIDRLYGLPLDEFVRERDALARRLNRAGDREAGAMVKALRKPTAGAWSLNQAVRRRRAETDALLATGERLREAHEALLTGGDQAPLREAMDEERSLTSALADCAEAIASETGKSGPALRDRVRATLHAAAVDDEARDELAAGRFVREREAVGLGPFGTGVPATEPPAERARAKPERGRKAADRKRAPVKAAERKRAPANQAPGRGRANAPAAAEAPAAPDPRLAEAERSLAEARAALGRAESHHSASVSRAESAREVLAEAELVEREARRVARDLGREVAKQERKLERMRPKS